MNVPDREILYGEEMSTEEINDPFLFSEILFRWSSDPVLQRCFLTFLEIRAKNWFRCGHAK